MGEQWIDTAGKSSEETADLLEAAYAPAVADIKGLLGESPEAWRGAAVVLAAMMAMLEEAALTEADLHSLLAGLGTICHLMLQEPLIHQALDRMGEELS